MHDLMRNHEPERIKIREDNCECDQIKESGRSILKISHIVHGSKEEIPINHDSGIDGKLKFEVVLFQVDSLLIGGVS